MSSPASSLKKASGKDAPKHLLFLERVEEESTEAHKEAAHGGCFGCGDHDGELLKVLQKNREWVDEKNKTSPGFFDMLKAGQDPKFLYIGCSDARVNPGQMMGVKKDEMFVHRNVGNQCQDDFNFLSALEYSVNFLHVPHIIVCGHYECGAVRNSVKKQDIGLLENWLRHIRNVQRLHAGELNAIEDDEQKHRRLVELNVIEQCMNVFKTSAVQQHRKRTAESPHDKKYPYPTPRVYGLVFDPATGLVNKLDINFEEEIKNYSHIYDLC